jgi:hypothetical protein
MKADSNSEINTNPDFKTHLLANNTSEVNQSIGTMDMLKRDRFELLSAYLDGEVTAAERRQVEDWLANDPDSQRLYGRLLKLRMGVQTIPVPAAQPVEQTIEQVYQRMHRRSRRRTVVWGGSAIAALAIAAISTVLPTRQFLEIAKLPAQIEPLMVALNDPVVEIPKAGIAPTAQPRAPLASPQQQNRSFN